ncbi:MAG: response regulator [Candidatus Omnitrophica bacterium]|nr:response regulator [Candidatus Omnitrophota bacterium]
MEKKKVLIVDDEDLFLKITKINLERSGKYEVEVMSDATGILALVKSFNPDVILLDVLMPKMDGMEACKILNEDPEGRKIPIIVLSALDTEKVKTTMYGLGVVDFLIKPIEINELISRIEKILNRNK